MNAGSSYREAAIRGASPVRLVLCLYEQAIADLRRASMALEKRDVEERTRNINHALLVIAQLQGSLDMERGGEVARNLQRFYHVVRSGLLEAQVKQSARIVDQQISLLGSVHEAWQEVERVTSAPASLPGGPDHAAPMMSSSSSSVSSASLEISISDWNA